MLYDQALLVKCYLSVYQITKKDVYSEVAREVLYYVSRDMLSREGGFYSAEDADSEGVEGKFYLWELKEVEQHLDNRKARVFADIFSMNPEGNFRDEGTGRRTGKNILHLSDIKHIDRLEESRRQLLAVREKRIHPHKDKKILTDWNGLMITALARSGNVLANEEFIHLAEEAVNFISKNMFDDAHLLHRYMEGEAGIRAYLNDHAFLIQGLIELYQAVFNPDYLRLALELQEQLFEYYWDDEQGGFYFTAVDGEELLTRDKPLYDGVLPSGNSVALWNLVRLFHITGKVKYRDKAEEMITYFARLVEDAPTGYLQFLHSYRELLDSFYSIVIVGEEFSQKVEEIRSVLQENYLPNKVVIFKPVKRKKEKQGIEQISEYIGDFEMNNGETTIYVCDNLNCELPTNDIEKMKELLGID